MPEQKKTKRYPQAARKRGTVGVIGLGYVGLPLACLASEKGFRVLGFDQNAQRADAVNAKKSPFAEHGLDRWLKRTAVEATTDMRRLAACATVVICVPTPVDHLYNPDLTPVKSAASAVRKHARRGALVILESTVNPGVCEEVVMPILTAGNRREGRDFFLAHCPERINPGDRKWTVRNIPRVVGGMSAKSLDRAARFYEAIIEAPIRPMRSIREAEAVKIMENSFRDINIAFVNEMARSFEKLDIDILDVIEGAKTKPFAFMAHYPSCGVGGHCIPVDPYYLIERAKKNGFDHRFLKLAREINNGMPEYTVQLLQHELNGIEKPVKKTAIGVMGLSYKADVGDIRESPSLKIIELLQQLGADVHVYDPYFPRQSTEQHLHEFLDRVEAVILATNHREFLALTPRDFKKHGVRIVIDGKNAFPKEACVKAGLRYRGIGR